MFNELKTNRKKGTAYNMVLAKDGAKPLAELSVIFSRKILFVSHFLINLVPRKSILLIFVIIETSLPLIPSFCQYLFRYPQFDQTMSPIEIMKTSLSNRCFPFWVGFPTEIPLHSVIIVGTSLEYPFLNSMYS